MKSNRKRFLGSLIFGATLGVVLTIAGMNIHMWQFWVITVFVNMGYAAI